MRRVAGPAIAVALLAIAIVDPQQAAGQEGCSCTEKDPSTSVELQITAATPTDHSRIGPDQEELVVDLRGEQTELVGVAPQLLEGVDLAEVPVLVVVTDEASSTDECSMARPDTGSNLSLTGQVYLEETGPVVWTGTCQGTLTVEVAAPDEATDDDPWGAAPEISLAVLVGLALLGFALIALRARGEDRPPSS